MAATFVNLKTNRLYRVLSTEASRDLCDVYAPEITDRAGRQTAAYKRMPDNVLFSVQQVHVHISELDLPGPTRQKVLCSRCDQVIRDGRHREENGRVVCRPCTGNGYFSHAREITWPDMNWSPVT